MRKLVFFLGVAVVAAAPASAGVFTDDLSRCLVEKATDADKQVLKQWMFSAFSADPSLSPLASISASKRQQITTDAGKVYNKLLLADCRKEAVAALKNEGQHALGPSFGVLGRSVANSIFNSPAAEAEIGRLGEAFDESEFKKLFSEAGTPLKD